jgi:hypothetical protein
MMFCGSDGAVRAPMEKRQIKVKKYRKSTILPCAGWCRALFLLRNFKSTLFFYLMSVVSIEVSLRPRRGRRCAFAPLNSRVGLSIPSFHDWSATAKL